MTDFISNELLVLILSALPISELRGGIPLGLSHNIDTRLVLTLAIIGNLLPVIPIIYFFEPVSDFLRKRLPFFDRLMTKIYERTRAKHSDKIDRYGALGLTLFVAIPSPATGAWTGSLLVVLFGLKKIYAIPAIFLGVFIAAFLVLAVSTGAITVLKYIANPVVSIIAIGTIVAFFVYFWAKK
ncbi:hypothetical protein LCGC14_1283160 [marine sediment metagenome]|uniref:Ligand-binding protein SH3 n=1 Tax=marine sediment metagenome TaxID=412755 RepID=A0A0F9NB71_9ZZZZ